ncbi:MAG: hypothetical protein JSV78_05555 [Phycisphaerales bacterium]|nr:MAG: hypothetical protein JSV78_05555 [Phycisphaerales bacterium]
MRNNRSLSTRSAAGTGSLCARPWRLLCVLLIGWSLICSAVRAQEEPPAQSEKKTDPAPAQGPRPRITIRPAADCADKEDASPDPRLEPQSLSPQTTGGPLPRWVCSETTVTAKPVWTGEQIECTFNIRNEGKGDLNIKAKGG